VLQIEINRALYMNETTYERLPGIAPLSAHVEGLMETLAGLCAQVGA
jgi:N-formylglutamate amidohydrolase